MEENDLNLKRIELRFRHGHEALAAARTNLAGIQLRGRTLRQWLDANYSKELQAFRLEIEDQPYRGHAGLRFTGTARRLLPRVLGRPPRLLGRVWHCDAADKIFMARWHGRGVPPQDFEPFCDSVLCHGRARP